MSAPQDVAPPEPRRTRGGAVRIGPSVRARYAPGALMGLPIVSLVLSPLGAVVLRSWRDGLPVVERDQGLAALLAHDVIVYPAAFLLAWALLALWALVPMLATTPRVLLDESRGVLSRRRGLRRAEERPLADVVFAVADAERDSIALIGFARDEEVERWVVPAIGWDDASFDGLRVLQAAAGLRPAPPRPVLALRARRERQAHAHREMAERVALPWRPEYDDDPAAFRRDFDHARRVLGGKEPPAPEDAPGTPHATGTPTEH